MKMNYLSIQFRGGWVFYDILGEVLEPLLSEKTNLKFHILGTSSYGVCSMAVNYLKFEELIYLFALASGESPARSSTSSYTS